MIFHCPVCRCTLYAGIALHADNCGLIKWTRNSPARNYDIACICGREINAGGDAYLAIVAHVCSHHDWPKHLVRAELESM